MNAYLKYNRLLLMSFISNILKNNLYKNKRYVISIIAIVISIFAIWPLFSLFGEAIWGFKNGNTSLGIDGFNQIKGTVYLIFLTSLFGGGIGTINGWLLANCRFKWRKHLRIAQLIPLAIPAYLLSATLIDLGSINGIRINGLIWGVFIMSLTTYPYVFLLSTESFSICGKKQLEACRSLGVGPWESFFKIALPLAIPSIGAGIALMSMEVLNELGAVQLLNIKTISAGIVENWVSENNPSGAIGLAFVALILVSSLILFEKNLRAKSRRWTEGIAGGQSPEWKLKGIREVIATTLCFAPPLLTLGIPLFWFLINFDQIFQGLDFDLINLTLRSLFIAIAASVMTCIFALFLSSAKRWDKSSFIRGLTFISGIGYAIPGVVLAIALLNFSGSSIFISPFLLLLWGYCDRFLAVAKGGLDAGFERIPPNIDEAASGLGNSWYGVLKKIHLPLLKGPLTVGALLVFVDTLKELPLTFILRPFDFDTLSVRIYQYAGDERLPEAIIPALIIITLGLIASMLLIPTLEKISDN